MCILFICILSVGGQPTGCPPYEIEVIEECPPSLIAVRGSFIAVRGSFIATRGSFNSILPLDKMGTLYYIFTMWFLKGGRL